MNKTLLENRKLAAALLAVVVLASIFGVGGAKVKRVGAAALNYYNDNMAADFTAREGAAESLLGLAEAAGADAALIQPARQALADSRAAAGEPAARYRAGEQLRMAVELVYNSMPAAQRDEKGSAAQMAWSEFTSRTAILSHSIPEYNEQARAAQEKLSGFPAGILARLTGAQAEEMTA